MAEVVETIERLEEAVARAQGITADTSAPDWDLRTRTALDELRLLFRGVDLALASTALRLEEMALHRDDEGVRQVVAMASGHRADLAPVAMIVEMLRDNPAVLGPEAHKHVSSFLAMAGTLVSHQKRVVLEALDAIEDTLDSIEFEEAMADDGPCLTHEEMMAELGLSDKI